MTVSLVGAGPGDPGLITVRGLELLRSCDVVVYDRLVSDELVEETPSDALRICRDGLDQDAVNELLVRLGRAGLEVVRLKGGDPYVFGRGGEEVLALADDGVPFEVVPGVSALAAVPAAAGIPVTHRGVSSTVTIATGHGADGGEPDYDALVKAGGTLVLFMSHRRLGRVVDGLLAGGLSGGTPAAAVSSGTLAGQETVVSSLAELPAQAVGLAAPVLVVVGDVVALASRLAPARETECAV